MILPAPGHPAPVMLQRLTLPDPAICAERALYLHSAGDVAPAPQGGLALADGASVDFATYVNLLNLETWSRRCHLDGLVLRLAGTGRVRILARRHTRPGAEAATLADVALDLAVSGADADLGLALQPAPEGGPLGLLSVRIEAQGPVHLRSGAFLTAAERLNPVRLAICITTFRREAAVAETARRITAFLDTPGAGARIGQAAHLFVIDNGQSAVLPSHPAITQVPNRNLGGAGGFARALAESEAAGFSHCLFMDDDASFQMENLLRTMAFLWLARSPRAAVAGAMISLARPWAMWENGSVFDRFCRPLHNGTDLRDTAEVIAMELASAGRKPPGFYGGWWFFAFPVAGVRRWPFPFFVRGDDISFSLANGFDTATLNGVMSFQEDFSAKESPQTLYLDLRNHLHHHLVQDGMEIGALGTARIALWFIARSIVRMHYDSAEAQLMAWADVMEGPDHFVRNADMAARRAAIGRLIRSEAWAPAPLDPDPPEDRAAPAPGLLAATLMKLTLNGHLVPFWGMLGRKVTVPLRHRGLLWPLWGAREARFTDAEGQRAYVVRHDKRRFARLALQAGRLWWRWVRAYPALVRAYRDSYPGIASRGFWEQQFAAGPAAAQSMPPDAAGVALAAPAHAARGG